MECKAQGVPETPNALATLKLDTSDAQITFDVNVAFQVK